ncbi:MAG: yhjX 1 [Gammaproteobacteria bacterium]|nr:yhjX 1 [Gammaproteobacteria bacterium]
MATTGVLTAPGLLDRERTVAGPGFSRWLIPPAALAIHLCIGMAYGFSVFWLPLSRAVGITDPVACASDIGFLARVVSTTCDWKISELQWMFILFFVFLGSAAALGGGWLERAGPRKAAVVAAVCWCGGLVISAVGVTLHQIWLLWLGSGVIGGIGLGLGYISPVSTLIKWFPDRRGMATGMAIMGFGGGAMIGAPLADKLMKHFATPTSVGVWETFLTLAAIYFVFMLGGAFGYRVPPEGWQPPGWNPGSATKKALVTDKHVALEVAWRTQQFWLLWAVLCLNVTAGIGILGMASPLLQEVFGGRLIGVEATFDQLKPAQKGQIAALAAGFTGLLSLFNIAGRIFWASLSDRIGRKATYAMFFLLGIALYASIPWTAAAGSLALFVAFFCVILSMYGGGFATVPAYLADLFGTRMVGAIHGRLLTAWSAAGVLGPVLVNYIREYQLDHGMARAQAYSVTMFVLAGLLAIGFLCNWLIKPVDPSRYMSTATLEETAPKQAGAASPALASNTARVAGSQGTPAWVVAAAWLAVWIPLGWGVWITLQKAVLLFK